MAMKRCPVCGEKYSDTYRDCPFCEEEELWQDEDEIPSRGGHRGGRGQMNLMTPTLVVLIVLMACVLVWLLYGDKLADRFSRDDTDNPGVSDTLPQEPNPGGNTTVPPASDGSAQDPQDSQEGTDGNMPEDSGEGASGGAGNPDVSDTGGTSGGNTSGTGGSAGNSGSAGGTSYASLSQLPNGLTVSNPDFTREVSEGTYRLRVSGGSGSYTWVSENPAIASVDSNGVVTPVANGTVNILVSDGSKKAVSIVRVKGGGSSGSSNGSGSSGNSSGSGGSNALNREDMTLKIGESFQLKLSGVTASVTWAVGNSGVATVSGSGNVTGVSAGQTTVTASWDGQSRSCIVRVK